MNSFPETSANIVINLLSCIVIADSIFNHFDVIGQFGPKAAEFNRITQNNGHYAVEGHSRSTILIGYQSKAHMRLAISD